MKATTLLFVLVLFVVCTSSQTPAAIEACAQRTYCATCKTMDILQTYGCEWCIDLQNPVEYTCIDSLTRAWGMGKYNCSQICPTNNFRLWCSTFRWIVGGFTCALGVSAFIVAIVRCRKIHEFSGGPQYELMVNGERIATLQPEGYSCRTLNNWGAVLVLFSIFSLVGGILIMFLTHEDVVRVCRVESKHW